MGILYILLADNVLNQQTNKVFTYPKEKESLPKNKIRRIHEKSRWNLFSSVTFYYLALSALNTLNKFMTTLDNYTTTDSNRK